MTKPAATPPDSESLKRSLHDRIEQLKKRELALLNRMALQLDAEELARDWDEAFDADRRAGRLSRERVEQVLAEVRARHGRAP